ncbi:hypothetical protein CXG81DRAFT_13414 [Caulochytrium protostelioides]|uniref:Mob1/phocein n=1 Tax=Caulochytrium protostelioides TaxID=1555241 RepID=A0A4P9X0J3_9FUNG|nr:Mob1/phocein [Caulochytrium protostelioides]RKP00300.1 hypothetical protein CXG81DRAFT_13414 [Caulochytrium protostelioides]|eukprot:RKP00300.1 hypothetical protein CXG81DRAFT_13414 [Caulochytrium protostelioides]
MDYRRLLGRYEGKTFKSRRQFFPNSKRDDMQKYIVKTLGGGDIYKAIKPPSDDIHVNEWIAVNTIDFYNQLNLLYGCVSDVCTRESCPVMSAGARYEYLWPATNASAASSSARPLKLAAPDYIEHMLNWVESQLDDPRVFPEGDAFPPDFIQRVRPIHKRMFRFYAHVYHSHLKALEQMGEDRHMNTCFKHFLIFVTTVSIPEKSF